MSTVHRLPSAPLVGLAVPPPPEPDTRPSSRRRTVLGLALLALVVTAALIAVGKVSLPGAGSSPAAPRRQGAPATGTEQPPARPQAPLPEPPSPSRAHRSSDRVVGPKRAASLFAPHTWYVAPPPPPAVAPPPPPVPTAPPFPFTFVGSFAPKGEPPVFFLSRGDRMIDAHVGDRLEGVYEFESAAGGQLVFVYLPLNIRQSLPIGAGQ